MTMRKKAALFLLSGALFASTAWAQEWKEGLDYEKLNPPLKEGVTGPLKGAKKVEVVEFFWYECPHCFRIQKDWSQWLSQYEKTVNYQPVPVVMNQNWAIMGKAYYAMVKTGGFDEQLHQKLFTALHEKKIKLSKMEDNQPKILFDWMTKEKGLKYGSQFQKEYLSNLDQEVKNSQRYQSLYQIKGSPTIVVAGKYTVNPAMAQGEAGMIKVVDFLVKKAQKEAGN